MLLSIERIRLLTQGPIIDEATTPEGTSKNMLLLVSWIDSVLVGSLLFHVYMVVDQDVNVKQLPPAGGHFFIPIAKAKGLQNGGFDKSTMDFFCVQAN